MAEISRILRTPSVRMSFPNLLSPRQYKDPAKGITGEFKYSSDFLLEPTDIEKFQVFDNDDWKVVNLKQILADVAKEQWPDMNVGEAVKHQGLKWPIKDGNKISKDRVAAGKKHSDITEGKFVISAATKADFAPQLYVLDAGKAVELDRTKDKERISKLFVGGMYVVANIKLKPNETPAGKFLNLYLNTVLYVKPGERIGGMDASTMFSGIEGGEADFDPTEGMADISGL